MQLATMLPSPNRALLSFTGGSVIGLILSYFTVQYLLQVRMKPQTERQRSWVLTAISSAVMTASSIPYLWHWLKSGEVDVFHPVAERACCFFVAYLISDLVIGTIHYRSSISMLTGWIHHLGYIALLMLLVIPYNYSPFFCLCSILELPTLLLALGNLHPGLRNDYLFAAVFFLTRIALHIYIAAYNATKVLAHAPDAAWTPTIVLACVLPMHLLWMRDCIAGILRRRNAAAAKAKAPARPAPSFTAVALGPSPTSLGSSLSTVAAQQHSPLTLRIRNMPTYVLSRRLVASALDSVRARRTALLRRSRLRIQELLRRLEGEGLVQEDTLRDALLRDVGTVPESWHPSDGDNEHAHSE